MDWTLNAKGRNASVIRLLQRLGLPSESAHSKSDHGERDIYNHITSHDHSAEVYPFSSAIITRVIQRPEWYERKCKYRIDYRADNTSSSKEQEK